MGVLRPAPVHCPPQDCSTRDWSTRDCSSLGHRIDDDRLAAQDRVPHGAGEGPPRVRGVAAAAGQACRVDRGRSPRVEDTEVRRGAEFDRALRGRCGRPAGRRSPSGRRCRPAACSSARRSGRARAAVTAPARPEGVPSATRASPAGPGRRERPWPRAHAAHDPWRWRRWCRHTARRSPPPRRPRCGAVD